MGAHDNVAPKFNHLSYISEMKRTAQVSSWFAVSDAGESCLRSSSERASSPPLSLFLEYLVHVFNEWFVDILSSLFIYIFCPRVRKSCKRIRGEGGKTRVGDSIFFSAASSSRTSSGPILALLRQELYVFCFLNLSYLCIFFSYLFVLGVYLFVL